MRAGGLRGELYNLSRAVVSTDKFGSKTTVWEMVAQIHAERVKMSGNMSLQNGERFSDYSADFYCRFAIQVKEHDRLQSTLGGNLYEVCNVIPNREKQLKTLQCARINE